MIKSMLTALRAQPGITALVALTTLVLLVADYRNRLHTPVAELASANFSHLVLDAIQTEQQKTEPMQRWLAQFAEPEVAEPSPVEAVAQVQDSRPALLSDATELDGIYIRLRAVFLHRRPEQTFAVFEQQDKETRQISYLRLRQGSMLAGYTLRSLAQDHVVLAQSSPPENVLTIPVFATN